MTLALVYEREKPLFITSLVLSVLFWSVLLIATKGIALIYVLFGVLFYFFAQSALISYLKGTGVKITIEQFPDLHERIVASAKKVGLKEVPEAYLLHGNGAFNAFATRFLGRDFIVLLSDVVDALDAQPGALNFYIGHELGHIRRKHLLWSPLLWPAGLLPILGAGYSRAREYTCDRFGLACCDSTTDATAGLAALAAGGKRWQTLNKDTYAAQTDSSRGFWMSFHELTGDYPWLVKRMTAVNALAARRAPAMLRRHAFAWVLSAFVPRMGVGGAASSLMVIAIIGILAAIAIPAYNDYTVKAKTMGGLAQAKPAQEAVEGYTYKHQKWPNSNADARLGKPQDMAGQNVKSIKVSKNGVVVVSLTGGALEDTALVLSPYVENSEIAWACEGYKLPAKYLPKGCE
jgi:Zn-dependent protease with chaperone function/Tfp pilus assembly major pilin PilA